MDRVLHCWKGAGDDDEVGSDAWVEARVAYPNGATCMLPAGHDGPHEYTPDDQIIITLAQR